MYKRLVKILKSRARGTGKTNLLRELFAGVDVFWIDLLRPEEEEEEEELYQISPGVLEQNLLALKIRPEWVVIDEVQRAPKLLDVVHLLIEHPENR